MPGQPRRSSGRVARRAFPGQRRGRRLKPANFKPMNLPGGGVPWFPWAGGSPDWQDPLGRLAEQVERLMQPVVNAMQAMQPRVADIAKQIQEPSERAVAALASVNVAIRAIDESTARHAAEAIRRTQVPFDCIAKQQAAIAKSLEEPLSRVAKQQAAIAKALEEPMQRVARANAKAVAALGAQASVLAAELARAHSSRGGGRPERRACPYASRHSSRSSRGKPQVRKRAGPSRRTTSSASSGSTSDRERPPAGTMSLAAVLFSQAANAYAWSALAGAVSGAVLTALLRGDVPTPIPLASVIALAITTAARFRLRRRRGR